jgi:hypothetical protein
MPYTISAGNQYLPKFGEQVYEQENRNANLKEEMANRMRMQMFETEARRQEQEREFQIEQEMLAQRLSAQQSIAAMRGRGGGGGGSGSSDGGGSAAGEFALSDDEFRSYVDALNKTDPDAALNLARSARVIKDRKGKIMQYIVPIDEGTMKVVPTLPEGRKATAEDNWDEVFADQYIPE